MEPTYRSHYGVSTSGTKLPLHCMVIQEGGETITGRKRVDD
jgi:hypothetical protein